MVLLGSPPSVQLSFGPEKKRCSNLEFRFTWNTQKKEKYNLLQSTHPAIRDPLDGCLAQQKFHVRVIDGSLDILSIGTRGGNELEPPPPHPPATTVDPIEVDLIGCKSKTMKTLFSCFVSSLVVGWCYLLLQHPPWWPLNTTTKKKSHSTL